MSDEVSEMIQSVKTTNVRSNLHRSEEVVRRNWDEPLSEKTSERVRLIALEADIRAIVANEIEKHQHEEAVSQIEEDWNQKFMKNVFPPPLTFKQQATILGGFVAFSAVLFAFAQLLVYSGVNF